ncbi:MAG: alpha-glucosidase [Paludibacter sp. 47-17]|nr:MAG: alpha-glucosidase [Paludibacter sp. 47-17]
MKWLPFLTLFLVLSLGLHGQKIGIKSPNNKLEASLGSSGSGAWYLTVNYFNEHRPVVAIPKIELGLSRSDQDFSTELKFLNAGKPRFVNEQYTAIHGKRSHCSNQANELTVFFENPSKAKMNLIIRAYNDGVVFRYEFPEKEGTFVVKDEFTSYTIPDSTMRWLTRFNPANEGLYSTQQDGNEQKDWGYPALFNTPDKACWFLIHEAGLNRTYCGTKLSNYGEKNNYKLTFPDQWNGRGTGETQPTVTLPWKSPWRVIMVGSLATIVESTLVDDVSEPSVIAKTDWIRPGKVSWNYWSDNHGTRSYKTVCAFADLAATMGWPYTLLDWEWDSMGDGGQLADALDYIHSIGVKPLIWYNSGGDHTWVNATPKDRMLTHKNRMEEFARLKKMGIYGVKVDFFESEKQDMINYYIDILEDAARFEIMVYFHGCLVPRGWARTYPHLMTYEGVRGAEWYNNGPELTTTAPGHNTILPFTRNVVGGMDYTPVTFTNSQHPHITSYGHELALSVLFESGMQHMADRPEGYYMLPDAAKNFLREVPNAWDDTRLMDGYPGKEVVMARRKGDNWYIGGIHAEARGNKSKTLKFNFLPEGQKYRLTLIADGNYDTALSTRYLVVDKDSELAVNMLRRGGFAASLQPID